MMQELSAFQPEICRKSTNFKLLNLSQPPTSSAHGVHGLSQTFPIFEPPTKLEPLVNRAQEPGIRRDSECTPFFVRGESTAPRDVS